MNKKFSDLTLRSYHSAPQAMQVHAPSGWPRESFAAGPVTDYTARPQPFIQMARLALTALRGALYA
ncbi:hypothetical protein [Paenibacillus campinasensis]|uniref:hypothetical protein n=1 Tax=Paenibacillus campinasensis TaxID=66347 RepID=UPI001C52BF18|nr:hypothetical protein [Paenibacillus campinasensis]